jgi:NAD(P)-dependent dehydrogenase (short-subunit alcohol dehydrogenase family)
VVQPAHTVRVSLYKEGDYGRPVLQQGGPRNGRGCIVNTASAYGLVGGRGNAAYVAGKHGVVGLTKAAALEWAQQGIRINAVCPGWIRTPMIEPISPELMDLILAMEPIGRPGTPEEVAGAVLRLCSDAASFMAGHALTVDGGAVAQ